MHINYYLARLNRCHMRCPLCALGQIHVHALSTKKTCRWVDAQCVVCCRCYQLQVTFDLHKDHKRIVRWFDSRWRLKVMNSLEDS